MAFFQDKKVRTYGVMDVGSDAIKAMIFDMPGDTAPSALPRVREKFVWDLPASYSVLRLVKKIKDSVFAMTSRMGAVPEHVVIAMGPEVGEYALRRHLYIMPPGSLTRESINAGYRSVFEQNADMRRAIITAPVEVLVDGYPWEGPDAAGAGRKRAPGGRRHDVVFRTLSVMFSLDTGALFSDLKSTLSGIPMTLIPLAIAEKEALTRVRDMLDVFVIDVGASATTLISILSGQMAYVAFMPWGTRRLAEILSRAQRRPLRDAQSDVRHYAEGLIRDDTVLAHTSAAVVRGAEEWKRNFVRALDGFYPSGPISPNVLLTGGGARLSEIRAAVEAPDWLGGFSAFRKPVVRVVDGSVFFGGDTLGGHIRGPEDAGLAALAAYSIYHHPLF